MPDPTTWSEHRRTLERMGDPNNRDYDSSLAADERAAVRAALAEIDALRAYEERTRDTIAWDASGPREAELLTALRRMEERAEQAEAERDVALAGAVWLREALERCFRQLKDQQAMPDDSQDHIYRTALASCAGVRVIAVLRAVANWWQRRQRQPHGPIDQQELWDAAKAWCEGRDDG